MNIAKPTLESLRILMITAAASAFFGAAPRFALAYVNGLDVYSGNGTINWTSVKNGGYDFAFVKATEGVNAFDSAFTTNMSGAHAAGLFVGAYHFAKPLKVRVLSVTARSPIRC